MVNLAEEILALGKARRASILEKYVSDEQRSTGSKAPGPSGGPILGAFFVARRLQCLSIAPSSRLEITANWALQVDHIIPCQLQRDNR